MTNGFKLIRWWSVTSCGLGVSFYWGFKRKYIDGRIYVQIDHGKLRVSFDRPKICKRWQYCSTNPEINPDLRYD